MMPPLNTILFELFQAHNVKAVLRDDDILFLENGMKASAAIINETPQASGMSVRMDVRFTIDSGLTIAEAFVGIGEDKEKAIGNAVQSFVVNSFHVFLAAFFQTSREQITEEEWTIGGKKRSVTVGNVGIRGKKPVQGEALLEWFPYFEKVIGQYTLGPEPHWIRLYFAQNQRKLVACEVLLDNETWEEVQTEMSAFSWPLGEDFYSLRLFLVIASDDRELLIKRTVTPLAESELLPKQTVTLLAEIMAVIPNATDDDIYQALSDNGITDDASGRAVTFTRIAWGRVLLNHLILTFSPSYFGFDANGNIIESGLLADEPYFVAASQLSDRYASTAGFKRLGSASSEVDAANKLLDGSVLGSSCIFFEQLTDTGSENVQRFIAEELSSLQKKNSTATDDAAKTKPPKWQFWKRGGA